MSIRDEECCKPGPAEVVPEQIQCLSNDISHLENLAVTLVSRLLPVLKPNVDDDRDGAARDALDVPLAEQILTKRERVAKVCTLLRDAIERLGV